MHKYSEKINTLLFLIFLIITLIETLLYLFSRSNYYGLIYLLVNYIILFFLLNINFKSYKKIFLSKVIVVIILGLFSSFLLLPVLNSFYSFTDNSEEYISKIFIISKIIKPIYYAFLGFLAYGKVFNNQ